MRTARLGSSMLMTLCIMSSSVPGVAQRTPRERAVPFTNQETFGRCFVSELSGCVADGIAQARTGALGLSASVTAPVNGLVPDRGFAVTVSTIVATDTLPRQVAGVRYTIQIHVERGFVRHVVGGVEVPNSLLSAASVWVEAATLHGDCNGDPACEAESLIQFLDLSSGPTVRSKEDVTLTLTLRGLNGPLPAGAVTIFVSLLGKVFLGAATVKDQGTWLLDVGTVDAQVQAELLSITARNVSA